MHGPGTPPHLGRNLRLVAPTASSVVGAMGAAASRRSWCSGVVLFEPAGISATVWRPPAGVCSGGWWQTEPERCSPPSTYFALMGPTRPPRPTPRGTSAHASAAASPPAREARGARRHNNTARERHERGTKALEAPAPIRATTFFTLPLACVRCMRVCVRGWTGS